MKKSNKANPLKANNKTLKNTRVNLRLTQKQKEKLQKKADLCGVSMSEYIVANTLYKDKNNVNRLQLYSIVTIAQDLANHIESHYISFKEDEYFKEKVKELWDALN